MGFVNDKHIVEAAAAVILEDEFEAAKNAYAAPGSLDAALGYYRQAGLSVMRTLLAEPYLGTDRYHQGLLLHAVYHRPNGWDHHPAEARIPCGESCMWGDYHLRELAILLQRHVHDVTS